MKMPIPEEDAAWDLGDGVRVEAEVLVREEQPDDGMLCHAPPDIVYQVWTAAQVAATSLTLGQAVALATRRWRKKEPELPPGTRLWLEVTLPEDGNQLSIGRHFPSSGSRRRPLEVRPAYINIERADTKTEDELTNDIREQLSKYVRHFQEGAD